MTQKNKKIISIFIFSLILGSVLFISLFLNTHRLWADTYGLDEAAGKAGLKGEGDLSKIITNIRDGFIGGIGALFLMYLLIGGFQWMTSGGNPDKVGKAKTSIVNATIGLLIILALYAITVLIFDLMGIKTVIV